METKVLARVLRSEFFMSKIATSKPDGLIARPSQGTGTRSDSLFMAH